MFVPWTNSKKAPPPVETKLKSLKQLDWFSIDIVSPPPATEKKFLFLLPLIAFNTNSVPSLKGDFSNDPLSMYLSDLLTVPVNLAGLPAISIPCGFDKKGLPIGLQLIGNVLEEGQILNVANIFEKDAEVMKNKPKIENWINN